MVPQRKFLLALVYEVEITYKILVERIILGMYGIVMIAKGIVCRNPIRVCRPSPKDIMQ